MIFFFKNQTELAEAIRELIDSYWNLEIKEDNLIEKLEKIEEYNKELLYKDNDYTEIVKQRLGIKRLRILKKIVKNK